MQVTSKSITCTSIKLRATTSMSVDILPQFWNNKIKDRKRECKERVRTHETFRSSMINYNKELSHRIIKMYTYRLMISQWCKLRSKEFYKALVKKMRKKIQSHVSYCSCQGQEKWRVNSNPHIMPEWLIYLTKMWFTMCQIRSFPVPYFKIIDVLQRHAMFYTNNSYYKLVNFL